MPSHPCVQLCQVHAQHKACWALGQPCAGVAGVGHHAEMACSQLSGKVTSFRRAVGLTKAQVISWGIWRESFLRQFLSIFLSFPCHEMNKSWSIGGKGEGRGHLCLSSSCSSTRDLSVVLLFPDLCSGRSMRNISPFLFLSLAVAVPAKEPCGKQKPLL